MRPARNAASARENWPYAPISKHRPYPTSRPGHASHHLITSADWRTPWTLLPITCSVESLILRPWPAPMCCTAILIASPAKTAISPKTSSSYSRTKPKTGKKGE